MIFSSITFLYYFLPLVLLLYFVAPNSAKNVVLLLASLVFYGWGEPKYIILMIISIIIGYAAGLMIEIFSIDKKKQAVITLGTTVTLLVGTLVAFKFAEFFPVGISFYTFQILSYVIDVYRGNVKAQKNILHLATYISMFPQLIAGPIVRYEQIEKQLENRVYWSENIALGIRRFVLGLGKKVLLANSFGELCAIFRVSEDKSVLFFWIYAISFTFQVYFDFSGYSDMAIGLGKILGFEFMENFNYPYIARSVTEFWRRWHISLGQWFRDYVYIPLGGNRVSKKRWLVNILIVWLLTGFWHGAQWNFIVWGLYFAMFLLIEKVWLGRYLDKNKIFSHAYLMVVVLVGFVIFNAADLKEALFYIGAMFGHGEIPLVSAECMYYLKSYRVLFVIAIIGATPAMKKLIIILQTNEKVDKVITALELVVLAALMILITSYLVDGSFNPFLYFRF